MKPNQRVPSLKIDSHGGRDYGFEGQSLHRSVPKPSFSTLPEAIGRSPAGRGGAAARVQISTRLLALRQQLHAPVLGAAFRRRVGRDELRLAVAVGDQAVGGDSLALKVTRHSVGAPLRQPLVVRHPADDIAVSVDIDGDVGMLAEDFSRLVKDWCGVRPDVGPVEIEMHAAQNDPLLRLPAGAVVAAAAVEPAAAGAAARLPASGSSRAAADDSACLQFPLDIQSGMLGVVVSAIIGGGGNTAAHTATYQGARLAPSSVPYFFSADIEAQPDTIARAAIAIKHAASFLNILTFLLPAITRSTGFVAIYEFLDRVVVRTDARRKASQPRLLRARR